LSAGPKNVTVARMWGRLVRTMKNNQDPPSNGPYGVTRSNRLELFSR